MKLLSQAVSFAGGVLAAGVAAVTLFDALGPKPLGTIDDLIVSLEEIAHAIAATGITPDSPEAAERAVTALGDVSQALAENVQNSGESGSYLRVYSGVFDLPPASAVDLEAPDGSFASFGFANLARSGTNAYAYVRFNGTPASLLPGDILTFPDAEATCQIMYVGPVDAERRAARFRHRCVR